MIPTMELRILETTIQHTTELGDVFPIKVMKLQQKWVAHPAAIAGRTTPEEWRDVPCVKEEV